MGEPSKKTEISISNGTIIRVILIGVIFFALIKLTNVILIILTSIVIASFIESAVRKMKPYIKNRTFAVFLIYFISLGLVVGLLSIFIPVFFAEMSTLVKELGQYIPSNSILNSFQTDTITGAKGVITNISNNASLADVINSTENFATSISGGVFSVFGQAFDGILNFVLIIILSFYLSVIERGIENFLRIITPAIHEEYIIGLWQRTERKIGLWMQGQMLMGVIISVLTYLGLTILGVKYSLVLALLVFIAELVPFGLILAAIPGVVFAYVDGGVALGAMTLALYFILGQFETYLIYPLIVRKAIGISPLVVIISLLVGAQLAGFWGIILAVPCAVCLLEFLDDLEKKKILAKAI